MHVSHRWTQSVPEAEFEPNLLCRFKFGKVYCAYEHVAKLNGRLTHLVSRIDGNVHRFSVSIRVDKKLHRIGIDPLQRPVPLQQAVTQLLLVLDVNLLLMNECVTAFVYDYFYDLFLLLHNDCYLIMIKIQFQ